MELFLKRFGVYIILIFLAVGFFRVNGFFSNKKSEIIKSDGLGYYSYLPAIFIYGDSSQAFVKEKFPKYYKSTGIPEYMEFIDNKPVDKYFFGTAVLMYPFFITAHLLSYYFHQPPDGYSVFYQYIIGLAAAFYAFLGIYFCKKLLQLYGATIYQSIIICVLLAFGTNIYFYVVTESTMSHVYSFAAISAFLYFSKSIFEYKKSEHILPAFITIGLVVLIRPFNAMILLAFPFLAGNLKIFFDSLRFIFKHYILTALGVLLAAFIVSLQMIVWYKQTGHFIVYSYTYERFYFDRPNILNVLFSYRKGLFIYAPLFFISLAGFLTFYRRNRFEAISLFTFFILLVYVMSCWHQWYYGSSFGFRPMIEYYGLFAVLLLFAIKLFKRKKWKTVFIGLCFCTLLINQVQAYQYRRFILHWENMSRYKFWRVFLKTDDKWIGYVWDNPESIDIAGDTIKEYPNNFESKLNDWTNGPVIDIGIKAHSGKMVANLDPTIEYSNTLVLKSNKEIFNSKKPILLVTGYLKDKNKLPSEKLQLIVSYDRADGSTYFYKSRRVDNFIDYFGWKKFDVGVKIDQLKNESDVIKIYFWNPDKKSYLIDDVDIKFIEQK